MIKIKNTMQEVNKHEYVSSNDCFYVVSKTDGTACVYKRVYAFDDCCIYCIYFENDESFYTDFTRTETFNNRFSECEYDIYKCRISELHTDVEIEV